MQFAQLPQSGAYWSVLPVRSLLPSFRSLRYILLPLLLRNCALYTPLNCTIPSPVRFISLRFCFIQSFPHFTSTTSRAPPHRLSATCRPPRSLSFKWALRAVWQSAACGCFRSFLTPIPRVRGGMAVVADAPHIHSSSLLLPVLRCHMKKINY